uniref:Uncharacterized protein n=1 Tax=uncultured marine group II/III euryarchaeote SAT1000_32_C10 TaxID=1456573 RepID=A0A075IED2_9EURY|nr:hypothetical protein [uncultured marine group II/III euryarchaeote SAT1000_32_C10]
MSSRTSALTLALLMLFGTLAAPVLADGDQPETGERDHPPEEGSASVIDLLIIYPEPEVGSTHIDDISDDYGETTVDGYLSRLFEHVNQNYARSEIGAEFSLLPSMQVNMSHLDEDWKKQLSLAMMNPHNSPYVGYIEQLNLIRNSTYADVIVYWRESGDGGPGASGASRIPAEEDESYVHITHYAMTPYIVSHELGHLLGGEHHMGTQSVANISVDGGGFQERDVRTLMTSQVSNIGYPVVRLWAFSDANTTVNGTIPCGYGLEPNNCTFSEESPIGNSSRSNVDLMRVRAPIMAGFRTPSDPEEPTWVWPDPLPPQDDDVLGNSQLDISGPISPSSNILASWNANVSLRDDYGVELLPDRALGVRAQIDQHLGDGNGWLSIPEIADFVVLVENARNLTDSEMMGCCVVDYSPLQMVKGVEITVIPPVNGSVVSNGSWGWMESADLTGMTDSRSTRILDIPRVGGVIEEIPLRITLPDQWEFRYSAMQSVIEGSPSDFTVFRHQAPVASDIRITLGENMPPNAIAERKTGNSLIPLSTPTEYTGVCTDSVFDDTQQWWTVHNNGTMMLRSDTKELRFTASELNYSDGEVASVVMHCMDSFSSSSNWYENIVIDGTDPTWEATFEIQADGNTTVLDSEQTHIEVTSGSEFYFTFNTSDSSGLPVNIDITSDKSAGWRHTGSDYLEFMDRFFQGEQVNGMHLNLTDRHQAKEPSEYNLSLTITDDASNTVTREWTIIISDGSGPTIIPNIISNGTLISPESPARAGEGITLSLTESFDDLDAIDDVSWEVRVDGQVIAETALWSEIEKLPLPLYEPAIYLIHIIAWDSVGNMEQISFGLAVSPALGVFPSVLDHHVIGDLVEGEVINIIVTMNNTGADIGSGVLCSGTVCSDEVVVSAADPSGPGVFSAELFLNLNNTDPINLRFVWSSDSAGSEGVLEIDNDYVVVSQWQMPMQVLLGVLSVLMLFAWLAHRTWGTESQRP